MYYDGSFVPWYRSYKRSRPRRYRYYAVKQRPLSVTWIRETNNELEIIVDVGFCYHAVCSAAWKRVADWYVVGGSEAQSASWGVRSL